MCMSKQQASVYKAILLSLASKCETEIRNEYEKWDEVKAKGLYLQILTEIKEAIEADNLDSLKKFCELSAVISKVTSKVTLKSYHDGKENPISGTNLVILACKHNNVTALKYMFSTESGILNNLSVDIDISFVQPNDKDGECHNSFYYAICSDNVDLLDILIEKWPNHYFYSHLEELDEILSKTYEEIKLKNILLSDKMEFFVENKLIDLRFFSDDPEDSQQLKPSLDNVKERIGLVLEIIRMLETEYSGGKDIDEKFLFSIRFIAQSIHILKRQLKPTYAVFPWEEMEFCLVTFITAKMTQQEITKIYDSILTKKRILNHLQNFATRLSALEINESDVSKILPNVKRGTMVAKICNAYPPFKQLYVDHERVADIYSLERISTYIELALKANPRQEDGCLVIRRALQVIGECLKSTLESPKLSSAISELLLVSAPTATSEMLRDLRNSAACDHLCSERSEGNFDIFTNLQSDLEEIGTSVSCILLQSTVKVYRKILKCILESTDVEEIKEMAYLFCRIKSGNLAILERLQTAEFNKLLVLIEKLHNVTSLNLYEVIMFDIIKDINKRIAMEIQSRDNVKDYGAFSRMQGFGLLATTIEADGDTSSKGMIKSLIRHFQMDIFPTINHQSLKEIVEIVLKISESIRPRLQGFAQRLDEMDRLVLQICYMAQFEIGDVEWLQSLQKNLTNQNILKPDSSFMPKRKKADNVLKKNWNVQLKKELSTLEETLNRNGLNNDLIKNCASYKNDKKLQAVVEILVQEIMAIFESANNGLADDFLFLDNNSPLLIGKALHDYIKHGSALIDILPFDPSTAVISVARKFASGNMAIDCRARIGKLPKNIPSVLKDKYYRDLHIVVNQEAMMKASEKGDLEAVKSSIKKGADLKARNVNLWTALHFAAKGPNLNVVKFIFSKNLISKDTDGQSPLHIAATYGRKTTVKYFVEEKDIKVDDISINDQTPMHLAAQNGHKNVVEVLLKAGAKTFIGDLVGFSPLHYAIANNHKDVLMVLLGKEKSVDANETMGGLTPLHLAAEKGYFEIAHFLIQNNANVNTSIDGKYTPLHSSALCGHVEVVKDLILNGADVEVEFTPLLCAVAHNHESVAKILLKHGANVNGRDEYRKVALHHAAKKGYTGMVKILLKYKANVHVVDIHKRTALHFAAKAGHKEIVDLLVKSKASINAASMRDLTALHFSSLNGYRDVAELLIERGANVRLKDENGRTPLILAAMSGHKDIVELLIANGASVHAFDVNHDTALHLTCANSCKDVVDVLIKSGAKLDAKNVSCRTPLHIASANFIVNRITKVFSLCSRDIPNIDDVYENNDVILPSDEAGANVSTIRIANQTIVQHLLDGGANVHAKCKSNFTALHLAALSGDTEIVKTLIDGKAKVNVVSEDMITELHAAVYGNHKEVVEILLKNGSNVMAQDFDHHPPLYYAIKYNYKEIVQLLIAKGADITDDSYLHMAVYLGFQGIVELLLRDNRINIQTQVNKKLLQVAAELGFVGIVEAFIAKGADVDAFHQDLTPLHMAAQKGHDGVVKVLLTKKAQLSPWSDNYDTPLHLAADQGHDGVVEILLSNGVDIDVKSCDNRTAIEVASLRGHLRVVKVLLQCKNMNVNAKGKDGWTVLHLASQGGHLEIIKCLIDAGADSHAKTKAGSKPMHIAAREGHTLVVKFFLSHGCHINDLGASGRMLLHYATAKGKLEMVNYLVKQNVDISIADCERTTPIHLATKGDYKSVIQTLLMNGAIYNNVDVINRKPIDLAKSPSVIKLLTSIENLFKAVKNNKPSDVKMCIKEGAIVNSKNDDNISLLHYASWKGYETVVDVLLKHQANPNIVGKGGSTPLHYAVKFSHLGIVKILLSNGAKFNILSLDFKTPSDYAVDQKIVDLLKLVKQLFKKVQNCDLKVIDDLRQIKGTDEVKLVLNACNAEGKTLLVAAICNDFPKIQKLKEVFESDDYVVFTEGMRLALKDKFQKALDIFQSIFIRRKALLGPNNPCTLNTQCLVAKMLCKQEKYTKAMSMFQEIYEKQKSMLGQNNKDTLQTRSDIGFVLYGQGKDEEALEVYTEVYKRQKEAFGGGNLDALNTQLKMQLVLDRLQRYDVALCVNYEVLEKQKETIGEFHPLTFTTRSNIASVLTNQGKYDEALKAYEEVLELQTRVLGSDDLQTLNTQYYMANVLLQQEKFHYALQMFKDGFNQRTAILGLDHPSILDTAVKMEATMFGLTIERYHMVNSMERIRTDIFVAASKGDTNMIRYYLMNEGVAVNACNSDNRTALHFAVSYGHKNAVSILLRNGADATKLANKGNTSLHFATSRGNREIVEMLLQHTKQASPDKYNDFLNAQTTVSGSTSLHIAAKSSLSDIVKCLLEHGAVYNVADKNNKIPRDHSKNKNIKRLLGLTSQMFDCAKKGNSEIINKLNQVCLTSFVAIINARNNHGQTAIEVALNNGNVALVNMIIKIMQEKSI